MSKQKGKVGEREAAKELSRLFGVSCRRGIQYHGLEGDDVVGLSGVHIEVKRVETLRLYEAVEQAVQDAGNDVPLLLHRRNNKPWLAVVRLENLPDLVTRLHLLLAREETADAT